MALIDDCQEVFGQVVKQTERPRTGLAPVEVAAIVFDAGAVAQFLNHLDIVGYALAQACGLQRFALAVKFLDFLSEVELYLRYRGRLTLGSGHKKVGRIDVETIVVAHAYAVFGMYR